jgi:hypothetical protein
VWGSRSQFEASFCNPITHTENVSKEHRNDCFRNNLDDFEVKSWGAWGDLKDGRAKENGSVVDNPRVIVGDESVGLTLNADWDGGHNHAICIAVCLNRDNVESGDECDVVSGWWSRFRHKINNCTCGGWKT